MSSFSVDGPEYVLSVATSLCTVDVRQEKLEIHPEIEGGGKKIARTTMHERYLPNSFIQDVRPWMQENWRAVCAYAAAIYMVLIFGGQQYMAARPR